MEASSLSCSLKLIGSHFHHLLSITSLWHSTLQSLSSPSDLLYPLVVLCLQFSNSFLGSQICQTTQHSRTRSTCPEATSRGSGCFHLPPSHLTEALRQPHLTPLQPNLNHICGSVFKNCISSCSLGLVACLGGLCLTKDRGWSLIYLLPHLLFAQSSRCRFVSWIPTLATSGSCPLVKHPCLSACLMLCSSFGTAQSFVCFLLPRSYLYYDL